MRILVMTAEITYVPDNYHLVTQGIAEIPEICGLVVVRNRSRTLLQKALQTMMNQLTPALSWQIVKNFFTPTNWSRRRRYRQQKKGFWMVNDLNSPQTLEIIQRAQPDLILCVRSTEQPNSSLLKAAPLGGVHLHHGLLPEQKGTLCDLWAHIEEKPCGFTLHELTPRHDEGAIIRRVEVPRSRTSYLEYLERATLLELAVINDFIKELRETGSWKGADPSLVVPFRYHKSPRAEEFAKLKQLGVSI